MKVKLEKETLNYNVVGSGKPFIMLHGNMSSSVHLNVLAEHICEGVQLILPDMRGFGDSTYNNRFDSLDELAEDIIQFIDALEIKSCVIGGWSTGGGVALVVAAKRPDLIEKVVLVESVGAKGYPIFKKDEQGNPILTELIATKEEIANDPIQVLPILNAYEQGHREVLKAIWNGAIYTDIQPDQATYELYLDEMLKQRKLVDIDYALTRFNITSESNGLVDGNNLAAAIKQQVLIIQGTKDLIVPVEMSRSLESGLVNNQYVLGEWGHSPFTDKPAEVCKLIFDYVKGE